MNALRLFGLRLLLTAGVTAWVIWAAAIYLLGLPLLLALCAIAGAVEHMPAYWGKVVETWRLQRSLFAKAWG